MPGRRMSVSSSVNSLAVSSNLGLAAPDAAWLAGSRRQVVDHELGVGGAGRSRRAGRARAAGPAARSNEKGFGQVVVRAAVEPRGRGPATASRAVSIERRGVQTAASRIRRQAAEPVHGGQRHVQHDRVVVAGARHCHGRSHRHRATSDQVTTSSARATPQQRSDLRLILDDQQLAWACTFACRNLEPSMKLPDAAHGLIAGSEVTSLRWRSVRDHRRPTRSAPHATSADRANDRGSGRDVATLAAGGVGLRVERSAVPRRPKHPPR